MVTLLATVEDKRIPGIAFAFVEFAKPLDPIHRPRPALHVKGAAVRGSAVVAGVANPSTGCRVGRYHENLDLRIVGNAGS